MSIFHSRLHPSLACWHSSITLTLLNLWLEHHYFIPDTITAFITAPLGWVLLHRIDASQSPSVLLGMDLCPLFQSVLVYHLQYSPCPPCTLHIQSLHLSRWRTSLSPEFIIIAVQTLFCSLASWHLNTTLVRYHKSDPMTLERNVTHSPGQSHSRIHWASPALLHSWRTVLSYFCRHWLDRRGSGCD